MESTADTPHIRATAWLSRGFEALPARLDARQADAYDFDVLIVGSGYGGAVALSRLIDCRDGGRALRIGLLERGEEYLPGAFPSRLSDVAGHVRFVAPGATRPRGMSSGLFDVRVGNDVHTLLASGLGGGSLINAGVMAMPRPSVFDHPRWPAALRGRGAALVDSGRAMAAELGATPHTASAQAKRAAMAGLARTLNATLEPLSITMAAQTGANRQGVRMNACIACGDCATGCNHGAKLSLDTTLLATARGRDDVELYTGATVLRVLPMTRGWIVEAVHTHPHRRRREPGPERVRARRVILAAGTLGSTEILLRSRSAGLALSPLLGQRYSSNGDAMTTLYDARVDIHAVADERVDAAVRDVGPTIQTCIRTRTDPVDAHDAARTDDPNRDFVIQDLTVPAPLRRAFEEITLTACALDGLRRPDLRTHAEGAPVADDPNAVDPQRIRRSVLVATIGHDDADGRIVLNVPGPDDAGEDDLHGDGAVSVHWPALRSDPRFAARHVALERAAAGIGAATLANPMWRALPPDMGDVLDAPLGPLTTVHPLGGCPMGDGGDSGVVDDVGRVFVGTSRDVHEGLVVLDGSIVPTSLGINPALTIATLADRAIGALREAWGLTVVDASPPDECDRPHVRTPPAAETPKPTMVVLSERLGGRLPLRFDGATVDCDVELELRSWPVALAALTSPHARERTIVLDPDSSRLRVRAATGALLHVARIGGEMRLFGHAPSTPGKRRFDGLKAWLVNRGLRDGAQFAMEWLQGSARPGGGRWRMALALATYAGDARTLDYALTQRRASPDAPWRDAFAGDIAGTKSLTYAIAANPWTQLQQVALRAFPGWHAAGPATLDVDLTYFERTQSLLLDIVDQHDMPNALADLASFAAYLARTLLHVHVWTFRKPDPIPLDPIRQLPGHLPRCAPQIVEFVVRAQPLADGTPVQARLTRYRRAHADAARPPVLMIHGYSASGTTFAHPAIVDGGLAGHLADRGFDAWVLDLRSSCGMPTAREPWTFEEVGHADIPLAIERVLAATGHAQLDVVAHCMGAAMLSMALFDPDAASRTLPDRIRRLVLSQVGPALEMAPANVARAYLMRYLQRYLPLERYRFRPDDAAGAAATVLDRLLASVPYPRDEFRIENPVWPPGRRRPWAALRHRMDVLYGMTFKLANMTDAVLARLDDFFGPMNARTTTQVIHFTRGLTITDTYGRARYTDPDVVRDRLRFPVLSLHSSHNGLVSLDTLGSMQRFLALRGDLGHRVEPLRGYGHQDALIGRDAGRVFAMIRDFLRDPVTPGTVADWPIVAEPAIVLRRERIGSELHATVRWMPYLGTPFAAMLVPLIATANGHAPTRDGSPAVVPIVATAQPFALPPLPCPSDVAHAVVLLLFRRPVRTDPAGTAPGTAASMSVADRIAAAIAHHFDARAAAPHANGFIDLS